MQVLFNLLFRLTPMKFSPPGIHYHSVSTPFGYFATVLTGPGMLVITHIGFLLHHARCPTPPLIALQLWLINQGSGLVIRLLGTYPLAISNKFMHWMLISCYLIPPPLLVLFISLFWLCFYIVWTENSLTRWHPVAHHTIVPYLWLWVLMEGLI